MQEERESLSEEKTQLEERVKRESQLLAKQLKELKEQSEKDLREKNENILRLNNILSESIGADNGEVKQLKDQIEKRVKELNDLTLVLSKRDKEIALLKKEVDQSASKEEEVSKLRDHVRALEMDFKQKKENSDSVIDRLREVACNTLRL